MFCIEFQGASGSLGGVGPENQDLIWIWWDFCLSRLMPKRSSWKKQRRDSRRLRRITEPKRMWNLKREWEPIPLLNAEIFRLYFFPHSTCLQINQPHSSFCGYFKDHREKSLPLTAKRCFRSNLIFAWKRKLLHQTKAKSVQSSVLLPRANNFLCPSEGRRASAASSSCFPRAGVQRPLNWKVLNCPDE